MTPNRSGSRIRQLIAVSALGALAAAPFSTSARAEETFRVGLVTFLSGAAAESFGVPAMNAFKVLVKAFNDGTAPAPYAKKGFGGLKIEAVQLDENGGATKQVQELRALVDREKVDAVVGYIGSSDCLAVAPVAEELKTVVIMSDCGTPRIFEDANYDYVFRAAGISAIDNAGLVRYLESQKKKYKSYSLINQDYAYGQDAKKDFVTAFSHAFPEAKLQGDLLPKFGAGQYGTEISALLRDGSDLVYSSFWGGDLQAFILQAEPRGLFRRSQVAFLSADHVVEALGDKMPDGVIVGARGVYGLMGPKSELNQWFWKSYSDLGKGYPTQPAYRSAQALMLLKAGVEKAMAANGGKKPTQEELAKALTGMEWDTPGGVLKLALGNGHQAIQPLAFGRTKLDPATKQVKLVDVEVFKSECVNPPANMKAADWLAAGFPGKCD
ncbi:ABC transporter substrate-binding protein [Xanthobacter wiegelii]|uniref:ABC transporter substrate-binding protein n=1 Tax=Xanthobacter wiegelii TaxID=3119913 RepID=UPI00372B4D66